MINTKALTIRFGHSRFWKVKFVPTNFYDNYHYIFVNNYIQDFFSQKIFHLVGFVYGHSVIKYYPNFIKAEVFIHDFRLEEFLKAFFKFTRKNSRRRITFRRRFLRPFFRKFFFSSKLSKFSNRKKSYLSRYKKINKSKNKLFSKGSNNSTFTSKNAERSPIKFNKRFFCRYKHKYPKNQGSFPRNSNNRIGFSRFNRFRTKNRSRFNRKNIFFKNYYRLFVNFKKYISKIRNYYVSKVSFSASSTVFTKKLSKIKKFLFQILKLFNFFIVIYKRFVSFRFIKPFVYVSSFFKLNRTNNIFFIYKRFTKYSRHNTFFNYSFLPYSRKFMFKHLPRRLSKIDILTTKLYRLNDSSTGFKNLKFRSYYSFFQKSIKSRKFSKKISKFKNFFKIFFSNYSFSPFFTNYNIYNNYFNTNFSFSNIISRPLNFYSRSKCIPKFFGFRKKFVDRTKKTRVFSSRRLHKYTTFRFLKKKRRKKIKRTFLPFFSRFKILSYNYFKFFRFKFFKFICSLFARSLNVKFLGLPIKLFIRVVPAYKTTVNIFLRYFITRLFYRYMLGDILNPIVRTSMKRFRGFTAVANGRFTRAQMASHRQYKRGSVSFSSVSIPIDYNQMCVPLKYGTCNIKLWIRY